VRRLGLIACGAIVILVAVGGAGSSVVTAASGGPSVKLGGGQVGNYRWTALAFRGRGQGAAKRPCLQLGMRRIHKPSPPNPLEGGIGEVSCRPFQPIPALLAVVDEIDTPMFTMLVMAFPPNVESVSLFFNGRVRDRAIPMKLLSPHQARRARLVPFRYGAFAFPGHSCVSRFVAHSRTGRVIDDGGHMRCGVHSPKTRSADRVR
jgi:hypothetical protein